MLQPHYASQGLREIYVGFDSPGATYEVIVINWKHISYEDVMEIDYSRILQPQDDGYDVQVFKQLKIQNGFVKKEFSNIPKRFDNTIYIHSWQKERLPRSFVDASHTHFDVLEQEAKDAAPLEYSTLCGLVDVLSPIECNDGNEFSCQHPAVEYPHAWIVMAPVNGRPPVTIRNMLHEMTHWKFTTLGFGKGCTPDVFDMLEHNNEFVLNPIEELHHSIVNSYADTAQSSVGHKASGRPISASIHAYGSFLIEAHVALKFARHNIQKNYQWFGYAKKWGGRLEESMEALLKGARTTPKGAQLLLGMYKWTKQFQEEYTDTVKTLSKLL